MWSTVCYVVWSCGEKFTSEDESHSNFGRDYYSKFEIDINLIYPLSWEKSHTFEI